MFALFFLRCRNEESNAQGVEQTDATEREKELARKKLTPATEQYGRREVRASDEVACETCQLVPETYNRPRVRSVCNGDAQGSFRFSGAAV
jgi:hypothetical protein